MAEFSFRFDEAAVTSLLRGPGGAVERDLARRAIRVESAAKVNASHVPPSVRGSGPAVQTGRLRSSITWALGVDEFGIYADIGSNVVYAYRVEVEFDRPYLRPALAAAGG